MVRLRDQLENTILLQIGISPALKNEIVPGATSREAYRQLLHSTLMPMSRLISNEFQAKTGNNLTIDFSSLYASDLNQRARALKSLVDSGISLPDAQRITGLTPTA
jgi:type II secretory pathway component PulF